jgi:hypothetical protein
MRERRDSRQPGAPLEAVATHFIGNRIQDKVTHKDYITVDGKSYFMVIKYIAQST